MNDQSVAEYIGKYKEKKEFYEDFAQKVLGIIKEIIKNDLPDVKVASYSSRSKSVESLTKKLQEQAVCQMGWKSSDGIIRNILILDDAKKYFSEVWSTSMKQMNRKNYELYKEFGVDIDKYIQEKEISIV